MIISAILMYVDFACELCLDLYILISGCYRNYSDNHPMPSDGIT